MKFKDTPTSEVINDIYARFFKKIKIVDENGNKRYNKISLARKNGKYSLKSFKIMKKLTESKICE